MVWAAFLCPQKTPPPPKGRDGAVSIKNQFFAFAFFGLKTPATFGRGKNPVEAHEKKGDSHCNCQRGLYVV